MTINSMMALPLLLWFAAFSNTPVPSEVVLPSDTHSGQWELVKDMKGVKTFFRWITKDDGTSYRERKGEAIVHCSLDKAVRLVSDAESAKKWMSSVTENYNLKHINQNEWYNYTLFSIPWPFTKRDLVSQYKVIADPGHENVNIVITCKDAFVPLKSGIERLTDYNATWTIMKRGENTTYICFNISSSAPPAFPRYIQDPIIERIFHNDLVRLKEVLQAAD
jgi:hypothetical protein